MSDQPIRVLFVCTGNATRSVIAACLVSLVGTVLELGTAKALHGAQAGPVSEVRNDRAAFRGLRVNSRNNR